MELLTIKQVADELDLSETSVRRFCYDGRFGNKIGRQWLISREELDAFKELDRKPGRPKKGN